MDEKTLYNGLLKGAIIGNLHYANKLASRAADLIENSSVSKANLAAIVPDLIFYYGDMLDEEEEQVLKEVADLDKVGMSPARLRALEAEYGDYFLEMISNRREKVETVYRDVTARSNILMEDEEITAIKKCESLSQVSEASDIWRKILRVEKDTIIELHKQTIRQVASNVIRNSGEKEDATEVWSLAQSEFRRKLNRTPTDAGYYQWRAASSDGSVKTSIFTFFIRICNCRWLDILRRKKRDYDHQKALYDELNADYIDNSFFDSEEESELRNSIIEAIEKLNTSCRKIVFGKWFGGNYGDGLTSKELSEQIGYSAGTIDNKHMGCLDQLRLILTSKM